MRIGFEGYKAVALVEFLAASGQTGISIVKNIKHDYGDPQAFSGERDALQRIHEQITSIATSCISLINADHGNVCGWDRPMARTGSGIGLRQFLIVDRMGIDRIEADDLASCANHDIDAQIAGLGQFVRGLFEEIVDLLNTTGKSRPIMFFRIERLYDQPCIVGRGHLEAIRDRWRAKASRNFAVGAGGLSSAKKNAA